MNDGAKLTAHAQQMFALVEAYQRSGLEQKAFSEQAGIGYTTLQYWLRRYRAYHASGSSAIAHNRQDGFIPLQPSSRSGGKRLRCVIEYPNGVVLRLHGELDAGLLQELAGVGEE